MSSPDGRGEPWPKSSSAPSRPTGRARRPDESAGEFYRRLTRDREEDIDLDALLEEHRQPHRRHRFVIFLGANVISELMRKAPDPGVVDWLERDDAELALSTIVIGEIAFGIEKIAPEQRARRLASDFDELRRRYADRIFGFTEAAALIYGVLMGERKPRRTAYAQRRRHDRGDRQDP